MYPFKKDFNEITIEDIEFLKNQQIPESFYIEYKQQAWGKSDDETREMLKDVSSFANASGGIIIVGVTANENSWIENIIGIENAEEEESRITACCLSSIEPRIYGLQIRRFSCGNSREILLLYIPNSFNTPHQIIFKGLYQIWKRYGAQKNKCTVEEIKNLCRKSSDINVAFEKQKGEMKEFIEKQCLFREQSHIMIALPLLSSIRFLPINESMITNAIKSRKVFHNNDYTSLPAERALFAYKYTIHGLTYGDYSRDFLEIRRNGIIINKIKMNNGIYVHGIDEGPYGSNKHINPKGVCEYSFNFCYLCRSIYNSYGIQEPFVFLNSFYFMNNIHLQYIDFSKVGFSRSRHVKSCPEANIVLPEITIYPDSNVEKEVGKTMDIFWQAFGFEKCNLFDENGDYIIATN